MNVVFLTERFAQLGLAAVYFAGIILAVVFWARHPRPAMFLALAAGMLLAMELVFIANWLAPEDDLFDDDGVFSVLSTIDSAVRAVAFGLLLAAVFSSRRTRPTRDFDDGLHD